MNYQAELDRWLERAGEDPDLVAELREVRQDEKAVSDRFYRDLAFGTGGLRGVIGAGTNRMNIYTVRKATQGLANYIISQGGKERGVAIAYDSRRMSPEFADEAALCLAANGIKAYVFDALRPTPELSFALRTLKCISGIVITASHNPPEYNGYKAYWEDGAQVAAPRDKEIIDEVKKVTNYHEVKTMDKEEAIKAGLYQVIGKEIDDAYMEELKKQIIHPEIIKEVADDIRIVYSPFHGTGNVPVRRILSELGFKHVYVVPEQELPDPDFTTLEYPNPEDPKAFTLALALAKEKNADIVLATDPDADRLGIIDDGGAFLHPNKILVLLYYYLLKYKGWHGAAVRNLATTHLLDAIAAQFGEKCYEVPVGFKHISGKMLETGAVIGGESSGGLTVRGHIQGKDGIYAAALLVEMMATTGRSLSELYREITGQCGSFEMVERGYRFSLEEKARISKTLMEDKLLPDFGAEVEKVSYTDGCKVYFRNGGWAVSRFSGTEPLLRVFCEMDSAQRAAEAAACMERFLGLEGRNIE